MEQTESNIDEKMKTGFLNFLECLELYMDNEIPTDKCKVTIYASVTLENGAIIRATNSYHGNSWFSNVSVRMDSEELHDYASDYGICYGQVILLIYIILSIYLYDNFTKFKNIL